MVADRLLGKYATILSLSLVYCLGHLFLALFESNPTGFMAGLVLIAVGSGGIKPCVSAHVGDQFGKANWHLLQKVFNAFYFIINFGSFFAALIIPVVLGKESTDPVTGHIHFSGHAGLAFGIPGILMGLATFFFWLGRKRFIHVPPSNPGRLGALDVLGGSFLFIATLGWPLFFLDHFSWWINLLVMVGCLLLFGVLFVLRNRLARDDGFVATMLRSIGYWWRRPKLPEPQNDLERHWFFGYAARALPAGEVEGPLAVMRIVLVFLFVSVFWALFDQHSSTWIEQAKSMERTLALSPTEWWVAVGGLGLVVGLALSMIPKKRHWRVLISLGGLAVGLAFGPLVEDLGTLHLLPSQIPSTNPIMVMLLIPLTTWGLYPLAKKMGFELTPLRRMTLGMATAGLAFVSVALLQHRIDAAAEAGERVHVVWQLIPFGILTLSEVMVSITGLEFAYSHAPRKMKSAIMGVWLLTVALGNKMVALFAVFSNLSPAAFFWNFAGFMGVAALLFGVLAYFYKGKEYAQ